jgi:hypothetical protein
MRCLVGYKSDSTIFLDGEGDITSPRLCERVQS